MSESFPGWVLDPARNIYYYFSAELNAYIYQDGNRIPLNQEQAGDARRNSEDKPRSYKTELDRALQQTISNVPKHGEQLQSHETQYEEPQPHGNDEQRRSHNPRSGRGGRAFQKGTAAAQGHQSGAARTCWNTDPETGGRYHFNPTTLTFDYESGLRTTVRPHPPLESTTLKISVPPEWLKMGLNTNQIKHLLSEQGYAPPDLWDKPLHLSP
jgi:hypothetical protein